jgi:hypothetical protein
LQARQTLQPKILGRRHLLAATLGDARRANSDGVDDRKHFYELDYTLGLE